MSTSTLETTTETAALVTAPITITEAAHAEVKSLLDQQDREGLRLRIYVSGGGCSGLQYGMALDEEVDASDETFEVQGLPVVVDNTSMRYLVGSVVDYITTDVGGGFKIENPNAVKSCGCGSSFSTEDDAAGKTVTGGCGSCGSH
jgi:iron-sulfur cluster assembly accessory protein